MSLINKALKKAQTRPQPQGEPQANILTTNEAHYASLKIPGRDKGRWYLIAVLLAPAMTLPILTSKWNSEKRHYREEIAALTSAPIEPVAKYDFRSTKNETPSSTGEITTLPKTEDKNSLTHATQSSRYVVRKTENPAVSKFINQSRISSIRAAGKNSKIVINNRTVPIDSYIDDDLPVRVSKVGTNEVVFIDDDGHEYHKHF